MGRTASHLYSFKSVQYILLRLRDLEQYVGVSLHAQSRALIKPAYLALARYCRELPLSESSLPLLIRVLIRLQM